MAERLSDEEIARLRASWGGLAQDYGERGREPRRAVEDIAALLGEIDRLRAIEAAARAVVASYGPCPDHGTDYWSESCLYCEQADEAQGAIDELRSALHVAPEKS